MPIEFLWVIYEHDRNVEANDVVVGKTNILLRLPADAYTITLEGSDDYDPPFVDIVLGGTNRNEPKRLVFTPKPV
jgi:hypothetical protein